MRKFYFLFLFFAFIIHASHASAQATCPGDGSPSDLACGLVGNWNMDNAGINWTALTEADSSGNGNTGTLVNMSQSINPALGPVGGQALSFNGSNQYIDVGDGAIAQTTANISICAWANTTSTSAQTIIGGRGTDVNSGYYFELFGTGSRAIFKYFGGYASDSPSGYSLSDGQWHQYCMTYQAGVNVGGAIFYRDGSAIGTYGAASSGAIDSTKDFVVGALDNEGSVSYYFIGSLDDVRVYGRVLSASEISALYALGTPSNIGYLFTVLEPGAGGGTVTGASISCGTVCSQSNITPGSSITLTATANNASIFDSWSGCTSVNGTACTVTLNGNTTVTATFDKDTTPPTVPTSLAAVTNTAVPSNEIDLSWGASSDNVAVAGYNIYRQGVKVASSSAITYRDMDPSLQPSTTYNYTVTAYDFAGNESASSNQASATTQPQRVPSNDVVSNLQAAGRTIDWSQAGIPGGIPTGQTVCTNVKTNWGAMGDGTTDDTAAFQNAINYAISTNPVNCPADSIVYIPAGNYYLAKQITVPKPVILQGAGPGNTTLELQNYLSIAFGGYGGSYPNLKFVNWTAGYTQGTTQITLTDDSPYGAVSQLHVGQELVLDELNDPSFVNTVGNEGTCGITANSCGRGGSNDGLTDTSWESGGFASNRALQQMVQITAISINTNVVPNVATVTIDTPLYLNYQSNLIPQAFFWLGGGSNTTIGNIKGAGIEDMSINDNYHQWPVYFGYCSQCFVKNVESYNIARDAFDFSYSYEPVVRDSYFHHSQASAPTNYVVEFSDVSKGLVENNIFMDVTTGFESSGPISGNVIAYNYGINASSPDWLFSLLEPHAAHYDMNLFEGNIAQSIGFDDIWGSGSNNTIFRNLLSGYSTGAGNNLFAINIESWDRYDNIIGNVLGTTGKQDGYEYSRDEPAPNDGSGAVYSIAFFINWYSECPPTTSSCYTNFDDTTYNTMARWGNFDYYTNTTHWNPNEIPVGMTVPATQTLPASLYKTSKPSWWGNLPWPSIGPDVSPMTGMNPAETCFQNENLVNGGTFNPTACYDSNALTMFGDVIGSGHVTIYDAELTAQYAIGLPVPSFIRANAQVDGNSTVDIYDAYLIAEYAIGLITKFSAVQP